TVTLRGNVANPGRYPWKAGMRIRDLLPDAQALLTRRYWRNRAAIVDGRATEYPVGTERQQNNGAVYSQQQVNGARPDNATAPNGAEPTQNYNPSAALPNVSGASNPAASAASSQVLQPGQGGAANPTVTQPRVQVPGANPNPNIVKNVAEDLRTYAPEINWDYAIIQRVNPLDLTSKLIWMSPRKAILEH